MSRLLITKEISFEAAHALKDYDGPCRSIHGHSYHLSVTVTGIPVTDPASPKKGMIMDFSELKEIIKREVIDRLDHGLILSSGMDPYLMKKFGETFSKVILVDYQPTSENLLIDFASRIGQALPKHIRLHSMKLRETASSFAEWIAD
jgi:6-pyruvoyltetrahydropterin/6-carboxytetrahydropterin synthase